MIKKILTVIVLLYSFSLAQVVPPQISVQNKEHDFGNIKQGDIVTYAFTLTNNGGDLLKISDIRASCGCTAAKPDKEELAPGETTSLNVKFNSAYKIGKQQKYVYIKSNDPETPVLKLSITADVVDTSGMDNSETAGAKIYFPQTTYNFGKVKQGSVVDHTFKFRNNGKETLVVKDIQTSCGCTAALISNKEVKPGEDGTIRVELDTTGKDGKISRTVTISSNDVKDPKQIITIFADVTNE